MPLLLFDLLFQLLHICFLEVFFHLWPFNLRLRIAHIPTRRLRLLQRQAHTQFLGKLMCFLHQRSVSLLYRPLFELLHSSHREIHVLTKLYCRLDLGQLVFALNRAQATPSFLSCQIHYRRRAEGMLPTVFTDDLSSLSVDNSQFCDWLVLSSHQID